MSSARRKWSAISFIWSNSRILGEPRLDARSSGEMIHDRHEIGENGTGPAFGRSLSGEIAHVDLSMSAPRTNDFPLFVFFGSFVDKLFL
jgi:hypothetical protein